MSDSGRIIFLDADIQGADESLVEVAITGTRNDRRCLYHVVSVMMVIHPEQYLSRSRRTWQYERCEIVSRCNCGAGDVLVRGVLAQTLRDQWITAGVGGVVALSTGRAGCRNWERLDRENPASRAPLEKGASRSRRRSLGGHVIRCRVR